MSEKGTIDFRDIAAFADSVIEEGEMSAQDVLLVNVVWSVWDQFGRKETDPDIGEMDAVTILEELPLDYDEVGQHGRGADEA